MSSTKAGATVVVHLIGPPGCGKGTLTAYLQARLACTAFSVGQLMRDEIDSESPLGQRLKSTAQGNIAAPELAMQVVTGRVRGASGIVILDGFPRTVGQAAAYIEQLGAADLTVVFAVSEATALGRLAHRMQSSTRADDNVETYRVRLQKYYDETTPAIQYLRELKCAILDVDAELSPEAVGECVLSALRQRFGL